MLVVRVGLLASGNSSTRKPLARRYSVMPSTEVTLTAAAGATVFWVLTASTRVTAKTSNGRNAGDNLRAAFLPSLAFAATPVEAVKTQKTVAPAAAVKVTSVEGKGQRW